MHVEHDPTLGDGPASRNILGIFFCAATALQIMKITPSEGFVRRSCGGVEKRWQARSAGKNRSLDRFGSGRKEIMERTCRTVADCMFWSAHFWGLPDLISDSGDRLGQLGPVH